MVAIESHIPARSRIPVNHVTHMARVPMDISHHRELASFQVANLQQHEVILGMPWLWGYNPTIDWKERKITVNSEWCTTECRNSSLVAYTIPESEALEENLITRFSNVQAKEDQSVKVKKLSPEATVATKGSVKAAGHDLYSNEGNRDSCKWTSYRWNWNHYPTTSQHRWTNCTMKQTSN